jgi:dUTPase
MICEKIENPLIEECKSLNKTKRGDGSFGSTGIN